MTEIYISLSSLVLFIILQYIKPKCIKGRKLSYEHIINTFKKHNFIRNNPKTI